MARVESALRRLDGVQEVRMDCGNSLVVITPATRRALDLSALPAAIERSSDQGMRYRAGRWKILASGAVDRSGGERRLRITGWPESYAIEETEAALEGPCRLEAEVFDVGGRLLLRVLRVLPAQGIPGDGSWRPPHQT